MSHLGRKLPGGSRARTSSPSTLTLRRTEPAKDPDPACIVAFDFETSRIAPGTPRPLYLTAYAKGLMHLAEPIRDMQHLHALLVGNFLVPELAGVKFVGWNANNFDTYFVSAALVTDDRFVLRPYLTRSNSLRGLRVMLASDVHKPNARGWEFLDGIAMLGLTGVSLAKFLDNFAPDYAKLTGVIDFEHEEFDPANPAHCAYAMRDSEGLWHGMQRAQDILMQRFRQPLRVTMGGACIRIFKANIPEGVEVKPLGDALGQVMRDYVLRGGYCYCVERYSGPVWKFDLNQAYAAAMREAQLPAGTGWRTATGLHPMARIYCVRITARKPGNIVPFYHRTEVAARLRSVFAFDTIADTWITDIEHRQLVAEGWSIECHESYWFDQSFSMRDYVDALERVRMTCEGGPAGPIGTMVKMVGNHSYGKTLEQTDNTEFVIARESPPGFVPFYPDGEDDPLPFVHYRIVEPGELRPKDYHQPHIGAWITAHVRMVVRRAALLDPKAWLYADTDCVVFSRDVGDRLDIHPSRYGAWKREEQGKQFRIIAKKVYFDVERMNTAREETDPRKVAEIVKKAGHAKGLNVKRLVPSDFETWFEGTPPEQEQTQRQNFMRVMQGAEMYRRQVRRGTGAGPKPKVPKQSRFVTDNASRGATNR